MRITLALLGAALVGVAGTANAQAATTHSADSAAALKVAVSIFDAMRKRDTTMARAAFAPDARLTTVGMTREGTPRVQSEKVDVMVNALAQPSDSVWDERIYGPEVRIDGNLATIWMEYDFYLGSQFSHCGVDAFQLAKHPEGWKIVALADTRRRQGCPDRKAAAR